MTYMKILFACGGTAGHINPALSVADAICKKYPNAEIMFAGNPKGMEATLVPKAGYPFSPIEVAGIQRKLTPKNIMRNVKAMALLAKSGPTASKIIKDFKPDLVFGTGGYVSGPVVRKAHQLGIKTITHEQNAYPGVTTKLLSGSVDKILLAVEGAKKHLSPSVHHKIKVTGNPVRQAIFLADRENSRVRLGVGERICVLSFGGSLGADKINEAVADIISYHCAGEKIHHIHATGSANYQDFLRLLAERDISPDHKPFIDIREYIDNMAVCLAAADVVICRAGAITISELMAAGRASILIPSPNVAENHQYHNAMELVNNGAALLLEEKDLTGQKLWQMVSELAEDHGRIAELSSCARNMVVGDANQMILEEILSLLAKK